MKYLYVLRHAKSSWDDPDLPDFERPLNDRGERDAPRMGKRLKERDIVLDGIYTSPAVRALTTAELVAAALGCQSSSIHREPKLYHADEGAILRRLQKIKEPLQRVMIVGHNPGLTEFVNELLEEDIDNIPTAGVVGAALTIQYWKDATWGCGKKIFFDFPKSK